MMRTQNLLNLRREITRHEKRHKKRPAALLISCYLYWQIGQEEGFESDEHNNVTFDGIPVIFHAGPPEMYYLAAKGRRVSLN